LDIDYDRIDVICLVISACTAVRVPALTPQMRVPATRVG